MKQPAAIILVIILVNACTWAFAMIMSSLKLSDSGAYQQIQHILSGSAIASLLVVGGGLAGLAKRLRSGK